jgi:hypothetical protein
MMQLLIYLQNNIQEASVEFLWIVGIFVIWFVFNRWILPRLGVDT